MCVCVREHEWPSSAFKEKWDFSINKTTNELSLTKTLDELKRLTPNLHDSLTLSRHRKCLSIQRSKSVRSVIKSLLRKKKKRKRSQG